MMPNRMKSIDKIICATASLAALFVGGACQAPPEPIVEPVVVQAPPPEPSMNVTADAHLTLFGELPERTRIPFRPQASAPMAQHSFTTEGADFDVDLSPDGKWMVYASTRNTVQPDIYLKSVDGLAVTQLTSDPAADVQPCFSPDGKSIAFASYRSGNWDIWMIGLEGGQATQVTFSPHHEIHPSFAPDGRRLVFCMFNQRAEQWEICTLQLDQPGSQKTVGIGLFPKWSPVEDSIVYQKARQRGGRWFSIWRMDLVMGEPRFPIELAASAEMALIQPSWSPDGAWVTYGTAMLGSPGQPPEETLSPVASRGDIWIMRSDGTSNMCLTDGASAHFGPAWSSDNRVYFTSLQGGVENVWSVRPSFQEGLQVHQPTKDSAAHIPNRGVGTRNEQGGQGG